MIGTSQAKPLPVRAAPLPDESLNSLLRRTSQAMGYENPRRLLALLANQGPLPPHINELAPGRILEYLATLVQLPAELLGSLTIHRHTPALVLSREAQQTPNVCDAATASRYFTSSWPVCPQCLQQDSVPYERLLWSFRPNTVCRIHGCLLLNRCSACGRRLRADRLEVTRCSCGALVTDATPVHLSADGVALAHKLRQVLVGETTPPAGMAPAAAFRWAGRLASAISKTPDWLADLADRTCLEPAAHTEILSWLAAADILDDWPNRLEHFLDVFQRVDKHRTTSTGVGRRFGMLLWHAAKLESLGHPAPADALRHYLLERYEGGHLSKKVCLFSKSEARNKLRERTWITQTHAARTLQLRFGTIGNLIERGILIGKLLKAGEKGRSVGLVNRRSVEALKLDLKTALDVKTTASRVGVGLHAVRELIHLDVLPQAIRTAQGWRVPRRALDQMAMFLQELPRGNPPDSRWISPRQATRNYGPTGLTLGRLIQFVLSGELRARMAEPQRRLHGILVSADNLDSLVPRIRELRAQRVGYPVHQVAKILFPNRPIKATVLEKWITAKLIKAERAGRAKVVSAEEIERFRSEFCLADEACRLLGISRTTLSRWEIENRIRPVYGKRVTPGAGFSLYRREDVLKRVVSDRP